MKQPPKKTIAELSVDTQLIIKRLKQAAVGDTITYQELTTLVGGNIQGNKRYLLQSARGHVLRNEHMVFDCIEDVGVKRISDSEIVETVPNHTMTRIRRTAKRGVRKLACAEYELLSGDEKTRFNAGASLLGAIAQLSKPTSLELIGPKIMEAQDKLPLAKTLELFAKT